MTHHIFNGGLEAGLLQAVAQDRTLTHQEQERLDYLNGLPTDQWVTLDKNGMAVPPTLPADQATVEAIKKDIDVPYGPTQYVHSINGLPDLS